MKTIKMKIILSATEEMLFIYKQQNNIYNWY